MKSQNKEKTGLVCGICKKVRGEADKGMMSGGTSTGWRGCISHSMQDIYHCGNENGAARCEM